MMNEIKSYGIQALALVGLLLLLGCAPTEPTTFATPEEAVAEFAELVEARDERRTEEVFGIDSPDMFRSGDEADDTKAAERIMSLIAEKVDFEDLDDDMKVVLLGDNAWPFAIPLVREGERWRFDTEAGREELLNRRIGFNELSTLDSLRAYVDAQHEYAAVGRDGKPPAFAQRIRSSEGLHDGLYWPVEEGAPLSPLGDLLAGAAYLDNPEPMPYQGYRYRVLTGQGAKAPGGEKSYLDETGLMTEGFAAIAWPAKYGNSGVMTFLVNRRGIVYQKDLGEETSSVALATELYEPDSSWQPTADSLLAVEE